MKMNYELKSEYANKTNKFKPIIVSSIMVFIVIIIHFFFPKFFYSLFITIAKPFWKIETNTKDGKLALNSQELMAKIDELERVLQDKKALYDYSDSLKKENEDLKALMGRKEDKNMILSQVLKKPPYSIYDSLILDIGEDYGVTKGDIVYVGSHIPIGEIVEVYKNSSKASLYSSGGQKFVATVGSKNIPINAYGKGGGSFEAQLPRDAQVVEGDIVSIPQLSNSFIGIVNRVVFEPTNPFLTILFSQSINIFEIKWVQVELNSSLKTDVQ